MFLLLMCMLGLAQAGDPAPIDVDYVDIQIGNPAPFTGFLFTDDALAKMIAQNEASIMRLESEHQYEIKKLELDLNLKHDLLESKYNSEIAMYQTMISVRDEELKKSAKKDVWQKWATYGGFVLGAATSVAIFYSVNTN